MNDIEKIEEAIEEKMRVIETYKGVKRPYSYFMLERFLKRYAKLSWQRGVDCYNESNLKSQGNAKEIGKNGF